MCTMPHLILECSKDLAAIVDRHDVLLGLHQMMADTGLFKLEDIKSRLVEHETFVVGDGQSNSVFAHLDIRILSGRTEDVKTHLSEAALKVLERHLAKALGQWRCCITVEVSDMHRDSYGKNIL
jgi:5-carboxymethyl-2-hydroxymuconate isomerase